MTTPREFLQIVVRPNIEDFHTHFADLRRAHNAISTLDALAAHLYVWATERAQHAPAVASLKDDSAYRAELAKSNLDFALLRDIAKAQKHVCLIQGNPQDYDLFGATESPFTVSAFSVSYRS